MSDLGKAHIVIMWTVGPDDVAAGDRLPSCSISKGPELSKP